ncbi:MAG: hypothetical protein JO356_05660 [Acidobacteria bacterium]|nr:hypothetical protein [Acidobacteriota bacterium]
MAKGPATAFPDRKISETLLQFAAPLLRSEAPELQIRKALEVAYAAWNAVIFADVLHNHWYIDEARRLTANAAGPAMLMMEMIARKRELFADDTRLIGNWKLTRTEDSLHLHADARDPYSLRRNPADQH